MSEGQFTIRIEISPAGTLAYLDDKLSGQFVGSITNLNKIYAYKNLLSKEEKHNMISYLNDRESIFFKRMREILLSREVTKAVEISDSSRAKMKSLVERVSFLIEGIPADAFKFSKTKTIYKTTWNIEYGGWTYNRNNTGVSCKSFWGFRSRTKKKTKCNAVLWLTGNCDMKVCVCEKADLMAEIKGRNTCRPQE